MSRKATKAANATMNSIIVADFRLGRRLRKSYRRTELGERGN